MGNIVWATALLIEADGKDLQHLSAHLRRAGFKAVSTDRATCLHAFYAERPDVVLIDVADPVDEVATILETIRAMNRTPVIALSADDTETEAANLLRMGADDYLHGQVGDEEAVARVEALVRKGSEAGSRSILADEFIEVDFSRHRVSAMGSEVDLTPTEFRLLTAFLRHPGKALSHSQLLALAWDQGYRAPDEVKLYVSYLRRKLRAAASIDPVETVRGIGYRYHPHRVLDEK
jgi:DNA-binding response OmpR family regulator